MKTYKIRNKADGGILEVTEDQLAEFGLQVPNQMAKGGMIKRADGSYSRRGLWDNIRANKGSGKKPTKAMLAQEKKIRAAEKAYGGYMQMGGGLTDPFMGYGGYMQEGGGTYSTFKNGRVGRTYPIGPYESMDTTGYSKGKENFDFISSYAGFKPNITSINRKEVLPKIEELKKGATRIEKQAYGGYMDMGGYMNPYMTEEGYLPMYQDAGKTGTQQWQSYSGDKDKAKGYWDRVTKGNLFKRPSSEAVDPRMQIALEKIIPFYGQESEGFGDWAKTLFTMPQKEMNNLLTGYYESPGTTAKRYHPKMSGTARGFIDVATDPLVFPEIPAFLAKGAGKLVAKAAPTVVKKAKQAYELAAPVAKAVKQKIIEKAPEVVAKTLEYAPQTISRIGQAALHTNEEPTKSQPTTATKTEKVPPYSRMVNGKRVPITKEEYDKMTKGQKGTPTGKKYNQNQVVETAPSDTVGTYNGMPLIQSKEDFAYGGYMAQGGINNPGFRALPDYVQENIIDNMAYGGCKECGGKMQDGGNLLPRPILNARLLGSGKTKQEANKYMQDYYSKAQDGKKLSKDQAYNKYAFQYTPSDERSNSPEEGYGYDNMYHGILMEKEGLSKDDALEVMERMGTSPLVEPNKIPDFLRAVEKTGYRYDEPYFSPYEREGILDYKRINPKTLTPKQPVGFIDEEARNGGRIYEAGDGKWIQEATKSIKKRGTEGVCTGSKFGGPGCPPGSKRYNLAKTFRKMAKSKKEEGGYAQGGEYEMTDAEIAKLRSMGYKIKEV
jgi:hypothetical protein